jgi:hypothetical protein
MQQPLRSNGRTALILQWLSLRESSSLQGWSTSTMQSCKTKAISGIITMDLWISVFAKTRGWAEGEIPQGCLMLNHTCLPLKLWEGQIQQTSREKKLWSSRLTWTCRDRFKSLKNWDLRVSWLHLCLRLIWRSFKRHLPTSLQNSMKASFLPIQKLKDSSKRSSSNRLTMTSSWQRFRSTKSNSRSLSTKQWRSYHLGRPRTYLLRKSWLHSLYNVDW